MTVLDTVRQLAAEDIQSVDSMISQYLGSDHAIPLIEAVTSHIVFSGGKRIRPLILLLSAKACGYQGKSHLPLATAIEFIHTATLLHDDVVDGSSLRRNKTTANALWGNSASVLVGDFLYSRAFQMMVGVGNMECMNILSNTTNILAEGEIQQLINMGRTDLNEAEYLRVIEAKTAKLFAAAAHMGGLIAGATAHETAALNDYGLHLGIAFQMIDDLLDYQADNHQMGKNSGDDLADGKLTLPLIYALQAASPSQAECMKQAIKNRDRSALPDLLSILQSTQALEKTYQAAKNASDQALKAINSLKPGPYREGLAQLATFALNRQT